MDWGHPKSHFTHQCEVKGAKSSHSLIQNCRVSQYHCVTRKITASDLCFSIMKNMRKQSLSQCLPLKIRL